MFARAASLALLVVSASALGACVTAAAPPPPGLVAKAAASCDDFAARCPLTAVDRQRCDAATPCFAHLVRPDVADAVFACLGSSACDVFMSELCFTPEVAGFTASARWATYEPACLARHTACGAEGAPFENDICQKPYTAATDAVLDWLQACLDGPCADIPMCERALVTGLCAAP